MVENYIYENENIVESRNYDYLIKNNQSTIRYQLYDLNIFHTLE
jgi:hypothetical protein